VVGEGKAWSLMEKRSVRRVLWNILTVDEVGEVVTGFRDDDDGDEMEATAARW
jgi:hypothetical protein